MRWAPIEVSAAYWQAAWRRLASLLTPTRLAILITLVGGVLRLYRYNALSLWFDEGGTIWYASLPWPIVLGLYGAYDAHPPLYYILVKLVTVLLPEVVAGRLLSGAAGTLTIPVLYSLAARLMGPWAAFVAAGVLAFSPVHVWYSQEARMYIIVALFVSLSYLALVAFYQGRRLRWAVVYGLSVLIAVYLEYSAIYALLPQIVLLLFMTRRHGRQMLPLWAAGTAAGIGFLFWLPQLLLTLGKMGAERAPSLGVTPIQIGQAILSLVGVAGLDKYFRGTEPPPWDRWINWQGVLLLGLVLVGLLGAVALARQTAMTRLVAGSLLAGTLAVGAGLSLIRPGFAERTLLPVVVGWALLLGALAGARVSPALRAAGLVGVGLMLTLSALTLNAIYRGADKDHWRDMVADAVLLTRLGWPVVTYHDLTPLVVNAYAPHLLDTNHYPVSSYLELSPLARAEAHDVLWLLYPQLEGVERLHDYLAQHGYQRLMHNNYSEHAVVPIYIDLYSRGDPPFLAELPVNGAFAGTDTTATGWDLPASGVMLRPDAPGGRELVLTNAGAAEQQAIRQVPAAAHALFVLDFEARSDLQTGRMRSFLICTAADARFLRIAPDGGGATIAADRTWHATRISVMCPAGTAALRLDLRNAGQGTVRFRNLTLRTVPGGP